MIYLVRALRSGRGAPLSVVFAGHNRRDGSREGAMAYKAKRRYTTF